mmetsp:Transcript_87130/g.172986  ORF Transcript_87130/g.172986 Transcript_87130/m.172986 type:complete len:173 (-) Transcript_87130:35-553(-)
MSNSGDFQRQTGSPNVLVLPPDELSSLLQEVRARKIPIASFFDNMYSKGVHNMPPKACTTVPPDTGPAYEPEQQAVRTSSALETPDDEDAEDVTNEDAPEFFPKQLHYIIDVTVQEAALRAGVSEGSFKDIAVRMKQAFPMTDDGEAVFSRTQTRKLMEIIAEMCCESMTQR